MSFWVNLICLQSNFLTCLGTFLVATLPVSPGSVHHGHDGAEPQSLTEKSPVTEY